MRVLNAIPEPVVWLAFLLAAAVAALAVYLALEMARRRGILALPGARQSHGEPTPTGGGIGIVAALLIVSLLLVTKGLAPDGWTVPVLPCLALLSVVGFLDDRRHIPALFRLFIQLLASLALTKFVTGTGALPDWVIISVGGLAIVWVMNVHNFMDGSHGMAGCQGLYTGLVLGFGFQATGHPQLAASSMLLAACCTGFLPWNFPRPRIFMGDAGSIPLGFTVAALLALGISRGAISLPVAILVLSVFLVDASLTLFQRVIRGERWYTAHKQHLYQRLIENGWSHSRVLYLYQAVNMIFVTPVVILAWMYPEKAWLLAGIALLLLVSGWIAASLRLGVRT